MKLIANWTVKAGGKRYEAGQPFDVDDAAAERLVATGAASPAAKVAGKPGPKKGGKAAQEGAELEAAAMARWGADAAAWANLDPADRAQRIADEARIQAGEIPPGQDSEDPARAE